MTIGPLQLVVFGFETTDRFTGEILRELEAIRTGGAIRLIDLAFVAKDEADEITALEGTWLDEEEQAKVGALIGALIGLGAGGVEGAAEGAAAGALAGAENVLGMTPDDIRAMADQVPPGTAAAVMLFEHTWAAGFAEAVRDAGGSMLGQGFLTRDALFMVGKELEALIETEIVIEESEAIQREAMLDALAAVAAAEMIEEGAAEKAVQAVATAEAIKTAAAANALHTLIIAGLIEEAATQEAIDTLVAAEIIEEAAIAEAAEAVAEAQEKA